MRRTGIRVVAGFLALTVAATAHAQTISIADSSAANQYAPPRAETVAGITREPLRISNWKISDLDERSWRSASSDFSAAQTGIYKPRPPRKHSRSTRIAQRIAVMAALGLGGFLAGGLLGAAIEGDSCGCDDPGLMGFLIGAPVGAGAGAAIGGIITR